MGNYGYDNVSHRLGQDDIGLGWLTGKTEWNTPRAVSMKPHKHPHMELIFCLKGSLAYQISGCGQVTVGECAGVVIPANTIHVLKGGTDAPCQRLGLHVSHRMSPSRKYAAFSPKDFSAFRATLSKMSAKPFRLDARLQSTVKELARLLGKGNLASSELGLLRALCCTILFWVADTLSKPLAAPEPQMMNEAVKFLETHFADKLTSDALVLHMGYGRTQLFHLFKQHTGLSPNEYLVRFRIKQAKAMLAHTSKPIAAIAKATGLASISYFNSVFLKYEGVNPKTFRSK